MENGISAEEVGQVINKSSDEIKLIYKNLERKHLTTEYLRMAPITY
jgi:hypothetical protein